MNANKRMQFKPYRWLVTYLWAGAILRTYGERSWPWNVPAVWSFAKGEVDEVFPRVKK